MNLGTFIIVWGFTGLFAWGKITGHLDWSWWLVFILPLFSLGVAAVAGLLLALAYLLDDKK